MEENNEGGRLVADEKTAIIPEMLAGPRENADPRHWNSNNAPMLMWSPIHEEKLSEIQLKQYLKHASELKFNEEQALGVLLRCMYDINLATRLLNRNIFRKPTEWSSIQKTQFRHAMKQCNGDITKVISVVTDKSHTELVNYYYHEWKQENRRSNTNKETKLANDRDFRDGLVRNN